MVDCLQIQGFVAIVPAGRLPEKVASLAVDGVACLGQQAVVSLNLQWDLYRPAFGTAISASVVSKGKVQGEKHSTSTSTKPMSAQTRRFIQHVFVPILMERYLAELNAITEDVK
jgi:hypothetical protein